MAAFTINELNSGLYTAQLVDDLGVGFGGAATLTLTLYDKLTLGIINGRNLQNVLNANQVVYGSDGKITWNLLPTDNPIITDGPAKEIHIALFTAKWVSGGNQKQMNHEVQITVMNLSLLP